jgi:hypothetical protein
VSILIEQEKKISKSDHQVSDLKSSFGRGSWIRTNDLQYPKLIINVSPRVLPLPLGTNTLYSLAFIVPGGSCAMLAFPLTVATRWRLRN